MHLLILANMGEFEADLDVSHPFELVQPCFDFGLLGHDARDIRRRRGRPEETEKEK